MRKIFLCLASVVLLVSAALAGCAGKSGEEKQIGDMPALVAEDLKQGNDTIFYMGDGYYYYSDSHRGFRHACKTSGQLRTVYSPECGPDSGVAGRGRWDGLDAELRYSGC